MPRPLFFHGGIMNEKNIQDECRSEVELAMLAAGMAKQHERYHDALQELVDNAVSSVVKDESYFEDPHNSVNIVITLRRTDHIVRTTIADNGPGIAFEELQKDVFRTGNKDVSDGILNNVGWGLKSSLAWFEETLSRVGQPLDDQWFTLVTGTGPDSQYQVDGPITGDLPISVASTEAWETGLHVGDHQLKTADTGTRVHVSCSRTKFDNDVWPSAKSLEIKAQALRELLGVKFRRILNAREDNRIFIDFIDETNNTQDSLEVIPISPVYVKNKESPPTEYAFDEFSIEAEDGTEYNVEFERGTIDFEAMAAEYSEENPGLFTTSGRFRTRYRPSQTKQGVDIYANGRVLMTSVFTDLFGLTRNNEYNYFGGEVRIIPKDQTSEVPTDNKKIRLDSNSSLWQQLRNKLSEGEYQPEGKRYGDSYRDSDPSDYDDSSSTRSDSDEKNKPIVKNISDDSGQSASEDLSLDPADDLFTLHHENSKNLESTFQTFGEVPEDGFVDVAVTSPPYFDLKDYGYSQTDQIGQDDPYNQYLEDLREVFKQVYNVTKDTGTLWVVVNTFKQNKEVVQLPYDISTICQNIEGKKYCEDCNSPLEHDRINQHFYCSNPDCEFEYDRSADSWLLQNIVVWDKTRALPYNSHGQFRNVFEYILCFSKTKSFEFDIDQTRIADTSRFKQWWVEYPERYHPRGKVPSNIWEYVTPTQGSFGGMDSLDHPAPFPPKMVERILRLTTEKGSAVLDPFAGSGMVPAVAEIMERQPIGFELSPKYCAAYPDVKAEVEETYGEELRSDANVEQEALVDTIGSLRQLKHARELLREYIDEESPSSHRELSIHTTFHYSQKIDPSTTDEDTFIQSDIYYVVDNDCSQEIKTKLERTLRALGQNGLNSAYDIDAQICVYSTEEFLETVLEENYQLENLYLYEGSRHYKYTERISLEDWFGRTVESDQWLQSFGQDDFPPIISNIEIWVDNPRRGQTEQARPKQSTAEMSSSPLEADGDGEFAGKDQFEKIDANTDD